MKKTLLLVTIIFALFVAQSNAQAYLTKKGNIKLKVLETFGKGIIEPTSENANLIIDPSSNNIHAQVVLSTFKFENALMKQNFLENFFESFKYPSVYFGGKFTLMNSSDNLSKDGEYKVLIKGKFSMHGYIKEIETKGTLKVAGEEITARTSFLIRLTDYGFSSHYVQNSLIGDDIKIDVECLTQKIKK